MRGSLENRAKKADIVWAWSKLPALVIPGDDASDDQADYSQADIAQAGIKPRGRSTIGAKKAKRLCISGNYRQS